MQYSTKEDAGDLARIADGNAIMAIDNTTTTSDGARKSVRISTTDTVKLGSLVVLDADHMPSMSPFKQRDSHPN